MEHVFYFVLTHMKPIELIVFWYPVTMGLLWIIGGILYYFRIERKKPLPLPSTPFVSVLVPAYNESSNLETTIEKLCETNYPNYEILIINDGSKDDTDEIAVALAGKYERVRVVDLKENSGKANALYLGFMAAKGEYLICVDGDSYLDRNCISYMMSHFLNEKNGERVGAVTGNPRVRNRSSLFAKIQLCEYASIISLIKRTQRMWGKVMTVSGVVVAYRKQALLDCGLWDRDMITEDIGVTWKLERNFWDVRYEPNAICWMLVPETLKGLYKQRKRWAQGGQEVMLRHAGIFKSWRRRRLYPVFIEQVMSLVWILLWLLLTITEIFKLCYGIGTYMPYIWKTQFLSIVCLLQFSVALALEKRYDKHIFKYMISAAWYPLVYWMVSGIVALAAFPQTILSRKKKLATWSSPDRGIGTSDKKKARVINKRGVRLYDRKQVAEKKKQKAGDNIIDGKQKWWKKILEILTTTICWAFILVYFGYMIYGSVCLAKGLRLFEIWIYNRGMIFETYHLLLICAIIFCIELIFMIFWKEYNRIRYGSKDRREFKPDATLDQMAEFFKMPEASIALMQNKKINVLQKNIIPVDFKAVRNPDKKLYCVQ